MMKKKRTKLKFQARFKGEILNDYFKTMRVSFAIRHSIKSLIYYLFFVPKFLYSNDRGCGLWLSSKRRCEFECFCWAFLSFI